MNLFPLSATLKMNRALGELGLEEKEFLVTRQFSASKRPEEWENAFNALARADRWIDIARAGWRNTAILAIVVPLLSLFFPPLLIVTGPIGLLLFVISLFLYLQSRKKDIPNALREIIAPLCGVLGEDVKAGALMDIMVRMDAPEHPSKLTKSEDLQPIKTKKVKRRFYQNDWFECQTRLHDGARIHLHITDLVRVDKIRKRNARGKTKFKTKRKVKRTVTVGLGWPKGVVSLNDTPQDTLKVSSKSNDKRDTHRFRHTFVTTADNYFDEWTSPEEIHGVIIQSYNQLQARQAS